MGFGPFLLKLFLLRSYFVFSFLAFYLAGVSFLFSINLFATEENNEKKIIKKITNTPVIKKNSQKKPPEKISEKKPPEKKPEDPIDFADFLKGEESYEGSLRFQGELSEQVRKVFRFEGYRVVAIRSVSLKTYFVQLIGKFLIPGWGLVWEKGEATKNLDEVVMLNLPVMALKNKFQLILVGPKGKVEKINIILEFPNLAQKKTNTLEF